MSMLTVPPLAGHSASPLETPLARPLARLSAHRGLLEVRSRLTLGSDERRDAHRDAFPFRLRLTPAPGEGGDGATFLVRGRDLSGTGIGFEHQAPLPFRRVLLEAADERLAALGLADLRLEATLRWCRSLGEGRYESGGRLRAVTLAAG